ncbi:hypothetical protein VNI00_002668 [Paramarasmius palmivorus]|uniref:ubiquitinyl hydrolase 1 n=1 Tax=Paramarasmius palmivorus TaxID=297713 RepID=A0AAW0DXW2_9AGAR
MAYSSNHYLDYIINHVFLPLKLPQKSDESADNYAALCRVIAQCSEQYRERVPDHEKPIWDPIVKMLNTLCALEADDGLTKGKVWNHILQMNVGDVIPLLIRKQNAAIILRKLDNRTLFEFFEVSPTNESVMSTIGKLVCTYPGQAIAVPTKIMQDRQFVFELANFLAQMNMDVMQDAIPTTWKAGTKVNEIRDTIHPRYITELLTGILHGLGDSEQVPVVTKRIADDVLWKNTLLPWRRSPIWLVIRVVLSTSLYRLNSSHTHYKSFMAFTMAQILRDAVRAGLDSDLLSCMSKKVARRLYKLDTLAPSYLTSEVLDAVTLTSDFLKERWEREQKRHAEASCVGWDPSSLDFAADTRLSLTNSRAYINEVLEGPKKGSTRSVFIPAERPRYLQLREYSARTLDQAFSDHGCLALTDFERAVQKDIDQWVSQRLDEISACVLLWSWIKKYSQEAEKLYHGDPEATSMMFLTLFELWVGLDKLCTHQCPLLREYPPEVKENLFEPLLLRSRNSLNRLKCLLQYLRIRHAKVSQTQSIFSGTIASDSFVVRFFDASEKHQALKKHIEARGASAHTDKVRELSRLNDKHRQLQSEARKLEHNVQVISRKGRVICRKGCKKCVMEKQATKLTINVFEWPLPGELLKAKATVVELDCPPAFGIWREATYFLLRDHCIPIPLRTESKDPEARKMLSEYQGLTLHFPKKPVLFQQRLVFTSYTKSFLDSHYKKPASIPCTEDQVCFPNALHYHLYDVTAKVWIFNIFSLCSIREKCTYQLPEGPYRNLQYAVDSTEHTSNEVIANQSECHQDLSLHEYIAYGSLRSGSFIQWLNILRELRGGNLTFRHVEVEMLLSQAAFQLGPLSPEQGWLWHAELQCPHFGFALLRQLEELKGSISASWMEVSSMRVVIALTRRIISFGTTQELVEAAFTLLEGVRDVTYGWMDQLKARLQDATDESALHDLQISLCELAATFRSAYDLDPQNLDRLFILDENVARFIVAGILIRDNAPSLLRGVPLVAQQLLERDRCLAHCAQPVIARIILTRSGQGLHKAIESLWPFYSPSGAWQQLPTPNERWLRSCNGSQQVHINLLNSQLLVDGQPLSRLPRGVTNNESYARIFGEAILEIVPSDSLEPDMQFATSQPIAGNQVTADTLVIRSRREGQRFELIPAHRLKGDLPTFLIEDYAHWLNMSTGVIELRPLDNPWETCSDNWRICVRQSCMWKPYSATSLSQLRLIDVRSRTAAMITKRVSSLENQHYITVTYSVDGGLSVYLPRYRLSFHLEDGNLACDSFPDMVVDCNQSAGVFIGLCNQMVLCPKSGGKGSHREVLVPIGQVYFQQKSTSNHTVVTIDTGTGRRVNYYRYRIDSLLGRLVGNVGLHGRLYRIYLHAVTAHCLPDPLTGRTGTEEAIHGLQSAACRSFASLDKDSWLMLNKLDSLTPSRAFYPPHLAVMQAVQWNELPPTAQHDGFTTACAAIFDFATRLEVFTKKDGSLVDPEVSGTTRSQRLHQRSASRTHVYYPPDSWPRHSVKDVHYSRRESNRTMQDLVFRDSSLILSWPSQFMKPPCLLELFKKWTIISGPSPGHHALSLSYSRRWIDEALAHNFLTMYNLCRGKSANRYQALFTFCTMGYGPEGTGFRDILPVMLAFTSTGIFCGTAPPAWENYIISAGFCPNRQELMEIARNTSLSFEESFAAKLPRIHNEPDPTFFSRRQSRFLESLNAETRTIVDAIVQQWPCKVPSPPVGTYSIVNVARFIDKTRPMFLQWYRNHDLSMFLGRLQKLLDQVGCLKKVHQWSKTYCSHPSLRQSTRPRTIPGLTELFQRRLPSLLESNFSPSINALSAIVNEHNTRNLDRLQLLLRLLADGSSVNSQYTSSLYDSLKAFQQEITSTPQDCSVKTAISSTILDAHNVTCGDILHNALSKVISALSPVSDAETAASLSGLWPRLTPLTLLESLAPNRRHQLSSLWIHTLKRLAQYILLFQRSRRLRSLFILPNGDFWKEVQTPPLVIDTMEDPDWLLIQVDSDFLIRPGQIRVANEMISPENHRNTLLQLNMGEGKSSVIVPMVAATLADGKKLPRVLVLKSLATQMFSALVERLSGLANRQILYLPFSRDLEIGEGEVRSIMEIYRMALASRAIIVAQPEHVLSYMLMTIDRSLSLKQPELRVANQLRESQLWLDQHTRDVLDESDEILHVRYQLIYTVGAQQTLELGPERWTTIQQVLSIVRECTPALSASFPLGVELSETTKSSSYPHIRLLDPRIQNAFITRISERVVDGGLDNCSFSMFPSEERVLVQRFIQNKSLSAGQQNILQDQCNGTAWSILLLLRGILGHGILFYVLKERRWRVDYGLDLARSLLAVPYRAKDMPSPRAEFGHPDVAILLTCLSYYYGGLTDHQVEVSFQSLYEQGNPKMEYEKWVVAGGDEIPKELRDLSVINLGDSQQWRCQLLPLFRSNHAVIDFYLSQVVFPKAAKEFPHKLMVSGWDLAHAKAHVTTGFSGTNDSRYLLPTSIYQEDPLERLGTNAKVLSILLQPENNHYLPSTKKGQRLSGREIIDSITTPGSDVSVRVLLDVGAQILEMTNIEVARYWIDRKRDVEAAVFFNMEDELEVLTRDGLTELLTLSPYRQQMNKCVVYLDDSHTRGTDLKFPGDWKACVTLGPKVTKDRLAQGCMRMRRLGHGQSVLFIAPSEVDRAIRGRANKIEGDIITNLDILRWAIHESCNEIERNIPRWVHQGVDYTAREGALRRLHSSSGSDVARTLRSSWLQPEARSLQDMYLDNHNASSYHVFEQARAIPEISHRCDSLGVTGLLDPRLEEEQEREVNHEVEEEPQKERPPRAKPAIPNVHDDVKAFITSGFLPIHSESTAFTSLFPHLPRVSIFENLLPPDRRVDCLFATKDFFATITTVAQRSGDYLRPINWVISGRNGVLVVLSPYEVNQLLPAIRQSRNVILHMYRPRTAKFMKSIDDLQLFCIPPLPSSWRPPPHSVVDLLNLAAGQLYFADYDAYLRVCAMLGVCTPEDQKDDRVRVQGDGFIRPKYQFGIVKEHCLFHASPVPYLRSLTGFRRKGQSYSSTHLGKILHTRFLQKEAFEDSTSDCMANTVALEKQTVANSSTICGLWSSLGCIVN